MGTVHMASGDQRSINAAGLTSNGADISSTFARTGTTYSFRLYYQYYLGRLNLTARADYYFKFAFLTASNASNIEVWFAEGATRHVTVVFDKALGRITVYRGTNAGTALGSYSLPGGIVLDTWYGIQVYANVHDSTGSVVVKLNNSTVLSLVTQDTRNGATGVIDSISIGQSTYSAQMNYVSDWHIRDDDWPGPGSVLAFVPTGAGSNAGWSASAGSAYACVDELPPTFTDYIEKDASVVNTLHDFAMADMSAATYESVSAVGVCAVGKLDAAGSGSIRAYISSNGTVAAGSPLALSTSELPAFVYANLDPNDSAAWTKAKVNALLAGVETI